MPAAGSGPAGAGSVPPRFVEAILSYNRGRYMECEAALEEAYAQAHPDDRPFVRALLALACAMHMHFDHGGGRGTLNLLRQSLVGLEAFRPRHLGVEVDELSATVEAYLDELKGRRKPGANFFDRWLAPRVRYRPTASGH